MTEILYITQCQTLFHVQNIRTLAGRIPGWFMRGNCRPFIGVSSVPIHVSVPPAIVTIVISMWAIFGFVAWPIAVMANDSLSMAAVLCVVIWLSTEWTAVYIVTWVCYTGLIPIIVAMAWSFSKTVHVYRMFISAHCLFSLLWLAVSLPVAFIPTLALALAKNWDSFICSLYSWTGPWFARGVVGLLVGLSFLHVIGGVCFGRASATLAHPCLSLMPILRAMASLPFIVRWKLSAR